MSAPDLAHLRQRVDAALSDNRRAHGELVRMRAVISRIGSRPSEYAPLKVAAHRLGVCERTARRWAKAGAGKLVAGRWLLLAPMTGGRK